MKSNNLKNNLFLLKRMDPKCRFCYSYTPQGSIENCCVPKLCTTNEHITLISTLSVVTNNSHKTTERSLLLASQQQWLQANNTNQVSSIVSNTIANSASITSTIQGQLLEVRRDRYLPYRPYIPEVIPQSVIDLQMNTANAGVPHSVFTIANCKGSQFVTT
jgi:hypothetical protein